MGSSSKRGYPDLYRSHHLRKLLLISKYPIFKQIWESSTRRSYTPFLLYFGFLESYNVCNRSAKSQVCMIKCKIARGQNSISQRGRRSCTRKRKRVPIARGLEDNCLRENEGDSTWAIVYGSLGNLLWGFLRILGPPACHKQGCPFPGLV